MKHRRIRFAAVCLLSLLLMLAPMTRASADDEGGLFAIAYNGNLVSLACKLDDNILGTSNSDELKALDGKDVIVINFHTKESQKAEVKSTDDPLALIYCEEQLEGEPILNPNRFGFKDGEEFKDVLHGWKENPDSYEKITIKSVKRPSGSDLFGTYEGDALIVGSPIFGYSKSEEILTVGFACDGKTYLDLQAYVQSQKSEGSGGGQTSGGQTGGGRTGGGQTGGGQTGGGQTGGGQTSGGQTNDGKNYEKWLVYLLVGGAFLALVIVSNGKRGKRKTEEKQPASPEANVTEAVIEERKVTVSDDSRGRGCVVLEGINGALKGASFPITSRVVLGRDPSRCVIIFPRDEKGISAVHCAVEPVSDDAVLVTDLGSTYGTLAGSKQLSAGMSARVQAGEHIALGGSRNEFRVRVR